MIINRSKISGVFIISLEPFPDERGYFMRVYDKEVFARYGINLNCVQENHSMSSMKGIIRGLHFQLYPDSEAKMVRCIRGKVYDVCVDLRKDSPFFGQWESFVLSAENKRAIFIPRGFAHGFCTLTSKSEVLYKTDNNYSKINERGIIWNDNDLNIPWPVKNPLLSEKDKTNMTLREFIEKHKSIEGIYEPVF